MTSSIGDRLVERSASYGGVVCFFEREHSCWVRDEALAGTCGSSASLSDGANGETRLSAVDIDALRQSRDGETRVQRRGCRTAMRVLRAGRSHRVRISCVGNFPAA